jgi:mono/diheme cytochrome c family protein
MKPIGKSSAHEIVVGLLAVIGLSLLAVSGVPLTSRAGDQTPSQSGTTPPNGSTGGGGGCCRAGDTTPPTKLVKEVPKGQLKSPYQDFKKVAEEGHQQFMAAGCNGCHGGTGGGGMCPPLDQGVWFFGSEDDTLFRLITLGTEGLKKEGFKRLQHGTVRGPMPAMGPAVKTSDDLWKIIAWIRSITPPPSPVLTPPTNE